MKNNRALRWIVSEVRFLYAPLFVLIVVEMLMSVCSILFALLSQGVIDSAVSGKGGEFITEAAKLAGLVVIEIILRVLNSRMKVAYGGKLEMHFRERAFQTVLHKDWSQASQYHSGDIMNRIRNDSSVIAGGVMNILPNGVMLATRIVGALIVLFGIDWQFAVILCVCGPVIFILGRLYSKKMKQFHKAVQTSEGKSLAFMTESVQNMTVFKAFGNEDGALGEAREIHKETMRLRIKRNSWSLISNVSIFLLFTGSYAFAVIWGAFKLTRGMSFGSFTAMVQLVNQVQSPLRSMGNLMVSYQNMLASAERVLELEDLPEDERERFDAGEIYGKMRAIRAEHLSFSYDSEEVLREVNFEIKKGEFVALAGISGGGKSTLVRLLLSLTKPTEGRLYIETEDGAVEISPATRALFGYVPQGNMLISGSVGKNIAFYADLSDNEIKNAAERAQIADVIDAMPEGYDSLLGEKGTGLSEGQIQRVAVARALARSAPVLLLDEATSALDEETEIELLKSLRGDKDKTVLIITHRKRVFDFCDRVLWLKDGSISEQC